MKNTALVTRALLRLVALVLVIWGQLDQDQAAVLYTDPDIIGVVSLLLAEVFFYLNKLFDRLRADA